MPEALMAGANVALTQAGVPATVDVVAGWDFAAEEFYIDTNVIACGPTRKAIDDSHFVFFNNLVTPDGSVTLVPSDAPSATDRERLRIDFTRMNAEIDRLIISSVVYDPDQAGRSFHDTHNVSIRIINPSGVELARYEVGVVTEPMTALILGEIYRNKGEWKFRAIGQGYRGGLHDLAKDYGLAYAG